MPITINGTTGISGVDGSAGTPALIGSDADTGIFVAAGQVSASVNGVAGNVPLVQGTAQNSTSGTNIDFTGIPSWVKRVTVMFNGVSTNGTSVIEVRLGAGSIVATGYSGSGVYALPGSTGGSASTTGIQIPGVTAANTRHGTCLLVNVSGNIWTASVCGGYSETAASWHGGSSVTLSGTLDRIRITTVNGTDTFDAGSINILYE